MLQVQQGTSDTKLLECREVHVRHVTVQEHPLRMLSGMHCKGSSEERRVIFVAN